jgi:hypothetical protein
MILNNAGTKVYDIRAGGKNWAGVGDEFTRKPRVGFFGSNQPREWLSITLHVNTNINPSPIPAEGLSLYEGDTRIGDEGAWYRVSFTPTMGFNVVELSTQPPTSP